MGDTLTEYALIAVSTTVFPAVGSANNSLSRRVVIIMNIYLEVPLAT
jgi:hypothetical protein